MTVPALPYIQMSWRYPDVRVATMLFAKYQGRTRRQAVATAQQARLGREQGKGTALHLATFARTAQQVLDCYRQARVCADHGPVVTW